MGLFSLLWDVHGCVRWALWITRGPCVLSGGRVPILGPFWVSFFVTKSGLATLAPVFFVNEWGLLIAQARALVGLRRPSDAARSETKLVYALVALAVAQQTPVPSVAREFSARRSGRSGF
jgi:hypothetical protein